MPHVGAQLRYLKELTHGILGAVSFAAPALALADRDEWIDWAPGVFRKRLHRTLGLSRNLIRPSVRCRCLASQMLNQILPPAGPKSGSTATAAAYGPGGRASWRRFLKLQVSLCPTVLQEATEASPA